MKTSTHFLEPNLYQTKEFSILSILMCVLRLSALWFPRYWSQKVSVFLMNKIGLAIGTIGTKNSGTIRCIVAKRISKCSGLVKLFQLVQRFRSKIFGWKFSVRTILAFLRNYCFENNSFHHKKCIAKHRNPPYITPFLTV